MSASASVGEFPELLYEVFEPTAQDNAAGIYGVSFFIRGKPWVVDIDDALVWDTYYADPANGIPAGLVFA